MKTIFMLDIETTGLDKKTDDILEIGVVEAIWKDGFYLPNRQIDIFIPNDRTPQNDFAEMNMQWLYKYCNNLKSKGETENHIYARTELIQFFRDCECFTQEVPELTNLPTIAVLNAGFDLDFLYEKKILFKEEYHYRVYDLSGLLMGLMDAAFIRNQFRGKFLDSAACLDYAVELPTSDKLPYDLITKPMSLHHWALFDAYKQLKILNGCFTMMRKGVHTDGGLRELVERN